MNRKKNYIKPNLEVHGKLKKITTGSGILPTETEGTGGKG